MVCTIHGRQTRAPQRVCLSSVCKCGMASWPRVYSSMALQISFCNFTSRGATGRPPVCSTGLRLFFGSKVGRFGRRFSGVTLDHSYQSANIPSSGSLIGWSIDPRGVGMPLA